MDPAGGFASARCTTRDAADALRGAYLESVVRPDEDLARGSYYWHEVIGVPVRGIDGEELGTVKDIYRVGETEVFVVDGGAVRRASTCRPSAPSSGSSRRAAARSSSTPRRSTCARHGRRTPDPDRPKAPRRRTTSRRRSPPTDAGAGDAAPGAASEAPDAGRRAADAERMTLEIDVLTLFPAMIDGPLAESIPGRIQEQGLATIRIHDLREWGLGRHRSVDDAPYGGGAGMILRPEPVAAALDALRRDGLDGDPARPDRRGLPPGARGRPRHAIAPHLRLPALRGRRRADPRRWSTSSCRSATTS